MKKIISVISLVFILALFSGCGPQTPPPEDPVEYNITFVDENGTKLTEIKVEEGKTPSYSYSVTDTAEWDYTFDGWSKTQNGEILGALDAASLDTTYYAVVSKVKQKYTVSFSTKDGSAIESQTVEYGSLATEPEEDPVLEGFRFVGWSESEEDNTAADFTKPITKDTTFYAVWNEKIDLKALLSSLLSGYDLNPYSYIPESMRPGYSENLVSKTDVLSDYTSNVNVSSIASHGYGEQWNMILKNINESMRFFNVLSVIDTLSTASVTTFNNYLDNNTEDTARHTFKEGIYNVSIDFDGEILTYIVDYTDTLPLFGEQTVQIALTLDVESGERAARMQIGDANALTYVIKENSYEFAIKYLGVRKAYFSVSKDNSGNVTGHIYEFLTVADAEVASAANFIITEDYVSAVGNKADGMIGFTGTISELYNAESGRLIGYEVEETLSAIVYNTLFFDLDAFDGIDSIRYKAKSGDVPAAFFVNGSSDAWVAKKVGGIGTKMLSRRYDIEFRTQYFYTYDEEKDEYVEIKAEVPMLFVQEEYLDTLTSDVEEKNGINITLETHGSDLAKILSDYDTLVPVFKENKETVTADIIVTIIGDKIVLE